MNLYPVNLNIQGKNCLIIGGGEVATRKAGELIACDAQVRVISPDVSADLQILAEKGLIALHQRQYQMSDLEDAFLIFAATNDRAVQEAIMVEAANRGILANCADDPAVCSFHVPAKVRRGNFLLTVSTGGGSPALAAKVRRELESEFGVEYQQFVELLAKIRRQIVTDGESQQSHKVLFKTLMQLIILSLIRREDWTALQEELTSILPEGMDIADLIDSIQFGDKLQNDTWVKDDQKAKHHTKE